jgi:hypothetical protein
VWWRSRERSHKEIFERLNVLVLAPLLISKTTTVQEYEEIIKMNGSEEVKIIYHAFIAIINKIKICVVVRKLGGNGKYHFWSVFPEWITSEKRDRTLNTMPTNKKTDFFVSCFIVIDFSILAE